MARAKLKEKKEAIRLRKRGLSYSEILTKIPVTKASLSLWLKNVKLRDNQKKRLIERGNKGRLMGAKARRIKRIKETERIKSKAIKEIRSLSKRELLVIGVSLYWGEGAKQKEHNISQKVKFSNSDYRMVKVFLIWLKEICSIPESDLSFRISLHRTASNRKEEIKKYWSNMTEFSINNFQKIDWKFNKISKKRKNVGDKYHGVLNIYVKNSTNLNRKIDGWIEGISKYCGIV